MNELLHHGIKNIDFHQLDVTDKSSISELRDYLSKKYQKIDVLVNNAGWASHGPEITEEIAKTTIATNYYGVQYVTDILLPLIKDGGRVINVTSTAGVVNDSYSSDLKNKFLSDDMSIKELDGLVEKFIQDVKNGDFKEKGWPASTYRVSKAAANTLTRIFARDVKNVHFYCCCPGWVNTDMTSHKGTKTPDEGADTPVWLATTDLKNLKNGKFYRDNKMVDF